MTAFRTVKLNLCTFRIILNVYFKFYDNWSSSLRENNIKLGDKIILLFLMKKN